MKIYVAGRWKEREKVKQVMEMFESRGHIITCDWTNHIAPERIEKGDGCFSEGHKTYAQEDLEGVQSCDVLVACMWNPDIFYKGAWIEIGIAIGLDKRIILIGNDITTVFLGLKNISVVSFKEDALNIINSVQEENDKEKLNHDCFVGGLD